MAFTGGSEIITDGAIDAAGNLWVGSKSR